MSVTLLHSKSYPSLFGARIYVNNIVCMHAFVSASKRRVREPVRERERDGERVGG